MELQSCAKWQEILVLHQDGMPAQFYAMPCDHEEACMTYINQCVVGDLSQVPTYVC